jgi:L-threonylcarbamoyladenylate synthase
MIRVLPISLQAPEPAVIAEAVQVLRAGGLVAMPTETVYGLAARALDPAALAKVFAAKGRPAAHPLIAHIGRASMLEDLCQGPVDPSAQALADAFWPGPLTLVVPRAAHVPLALAGGADSVAVRMPRHAVALALLQAMGEPLAAPSANRFQQLSPTRAEHVVQGLGSAVDLVLDAGPCALGIESTVIAVRKPPFRILRPGSLGLRELRCVVPHVESGPSVAPDMHAERASPGMDPRHYAPRAPLRLVPGASLVARTQDAVDQNMGVVVVLAPAAEDVAVAVRRAGGVFVGLPPDPHGFAASLYDALHQADQQGASVILMPEPPADEAWVAIADRLHRAAFA